MSPRLPPKHLELENAKLRVELTEAHAKIARLEAKMLQQPQPRPGASLPGVLTPAKIEGLLKEAATMNRRQIVITDSPNLQLQIYARGRQASWLFRWAQRVGVGSNTHKSRSIGLGSLRVVSLFEAREKALHYRQLLAQGKDPKLEREKAIGFEQKDSNKLKTFNQVIDTFYNERIAKQSIHTRRKFNSVLAQARANLGNMLIQNITRELILDDKGAGLRRMWTERNPSAVQLRSFLDRIFRYAKAMGWHEGENPAAWEDGMKNILPPSKDVHDVEHHPSMPFEYVPTFIQQLRAWRYDRTWHMVGAQGRPIAAFAIEMLILTGIRTKEMRKARFSEFDLGTMTWNIPGFDKDGEQRTKNGRPHRIPITTTMMEIVAELDKIRTDQSPDAFMFPGLRRRGTYTLNNERPISPLSAQSLSRTMRVQLKLETRFVNHGFRSSLEAWCTDNRYPESWWDIQVGHARGDKTAEAYKRHDQLERRREMMQHWDDHCTKPKPDNVITMERKRRA